MNVSLRQPVGLQHRRHVNKHIVSSPSCRVLGRRCLGGQPPAPASWVPNNRRSTQRTGVSLSPAPRSRGGPVYSHSSSNDSQPCRSFYFDANDFIRMQFLPRPYGPLVMTPQENNEMWPTLTFCADSVFFPDEKTRVLEVYIGGDTAMCLSHLLDNGPAPARPMPLDIMHAFIQSLPASPTPTTLLHVAITELKHDVFHGRLFFGTPATATSPAQITMDMDCRFSDACWLAVKFNVPMYVHRDVWALDSRPLQDAQCYHMIHKAATTWAMHTAQAESAAPSAPAPQQGVPAAVQPPRQAPGRVADVGVPYASILNPEAWEEVQLLKKLLEVAVKEEDYAAAIRLRDHPYMQLVNKIKGAVDQNQMEPARELFRELEDRIMEARSRSLTLEGPPRPRYTDL